ncbi:hypothetical protein D3C76_1251900 [compost metagenome]
MQGQAEDGAGQRTAGFVDGQQLVTVQQLAAGNAVGVEDEKFEGVDVRVLLEEIPGFLHAGKFHGALFSADGARNQALASGARVVFLVLGEVGRGEGGRGSDECAIRRTRVAAMPERPEGEVERQGDQEVGGPLAGELDPGCDSGSTARGAYQPEGQGGQQRLVRSGTTHWGKPCYWNARQARTAPRVNKIQVFLSLD